MYSLFTDDITFCASKCEKTDCFRHQSNIKEPQYPHSFSCFKGTNSCPDAELSKPIHRQDDNMESYKRCMNELKRQLGEEVNT